MSSSFFTSSKASSSKTTTSFDKMLDMFLPTTSSSSSSSSSSSTNASFRTSLDDYKNDPELFIGEDSDSHYAEALMQSDLFNYLQSYKNNNDFNEDTEDISLHRLRILLSHLRPSSSSKENDSF
ncbi:unnamed protein product [Cunninghamella echinulata]